jgi:DNA polymerase-3 subunit epsilon/ATP-dependent DNA helicase DinG
LSSYPDSIADRDGEAERSKGVPEFVAVAVYGGISKGTLEPLRIAASRYDGPVEADRFSRDIQTPSALGVSAFVPSSSSSTSEYAEGLADAGDNLQAFVGESQLVYSGGAATADVLRVLLGELPQSAIDLDDLIFLMHPEAVAADLASLARLLGIGAHDPAACEDLTAAIYLRICAESALLPADIALEIVQRGQASQWPSRYFFAQAAANPNFAGRSHLVPSQPGNSDDQLSARRGLRPLRSPRIIAESDVVATLVSACANDGAGYEPRPQQVEMTEAVVQALEGEYHLLVEAGTGIGKSIAYLLPAAVRALRTGERVVISTNTINLQEQLVQKDIPAVRRLLCDYGPTSIRPEAETLRWAALKGRRNYLCLQRFAALRRSALLSDTESRFVIRILMWLSRGGGDRSGLRLTDEEDAIWNRMNAEGANCFAASSAYVRNGSCQLAKARARAEAAHLVVVNHSLLLSDVSADRHLLPAYDRLVIDEAHNLEDVATDQFGFHAGQREVVALLDSVAARTRERETGLVTDVRLMAMTTAGPDRDFIDALLRDLVERVERARKLLPVSFGAVADFAASSGEVDGEYDRRLLLSKGVRAQPDWAGVELAWENLSLALTQVEDGLERVGVAMANRPPDDGDDRDALLGAISGQALSIQLVRQGIEAIIHKHDEDSIAWLTVNRASNGVTAASAPLNVGETLKSHLFDHTSSVVMTSATLTSAESFAYIRERLGLSEVEELALGYPFDYERSALLLIPSDMPDPTHPGYQRALERAVSKLAGASEGRALVLFTSHAALRATRQELTRSLAPHGIRVLVQGIDGTPQDLISDLRSNPRTVVCGTSSFWEGVDVVGEALSLLVITKLPFSVPSDPVFRARSELFEQPFMEYALPQAVLRFKQGFGRLIRHRTDRGVVAVLDRRVRTKSYGRLFLKSLPPCTLREARLEACDRLVHDWLSLRDEG